MKASTVKVCSDNTKKLKDSNGRTAGFALFAAIPVVK